MVPIPTAGLDPADLTEVELVEALRAAEEQKCRLDALQVELAARLDEVVRRRHAAAGLPVDRQGAGVASQVGLARRESPNRGARHLGLAKVLVAEMPHTLAAMRAGWCGEWRATLLARETACLSLEDRRRVDAELMADPETTEGWGDKRLAAAARARAYELDPHAALKRSRKAEGERYVSLRPAPDTMTWLTALLPVAQGVAAYAALTRAADSARADGDERSRGQVMADTLVTSVLTRSAEPAPVPAVPVAVNLTVSDATLLGGGHQPGWVTGYGPVPAGFARELVATAIADAQATLRRLYTTSAGALVAMDSRARAFPASLGFFIDLRDRSCRTPWCDAPIRHRDHVVPDHAGGPTSATNGQGLCEACNQAKEAPGFTAATVGSAVVTTTPTGQQVRSRAPDLPPGDPPVTPEPSRPRVDVVHPRLQVVLDDYTPAA
ncbi:hypothetical protein BKA08_003779 [Nocardioides marinisabuli]|uniref:HNH nuclease domain-containing protein n=1 Tax=Nocardioides marinisabuli TaxID=419476 RepID=A0A7Y9JSN6_9ACTN|nr:HNH endonuclease signature motif containing protein [Nocardioides marinisabuli]NYD59541.1 hypothetical protein [Nocardioides marinisabuli]